jgi:hypothetical protein
MKYVRWFCFGAMGFVLGSAGVSVLHWQFYAVILLATVVGMCAEYEMWSKCP